MEHILETGLQQCFDSDGKVVPCTGTGQDAEFMPGRQWPEPRFTLLDHDLIQDQATDLIWSGNANTFSYPLTWQEGLEAIRQMNRESWGGRDDWHLPNRRELRSLISHGARKPALPAGHPFTNIFSGWYWTSTTAAISTAYAWYVHLEGGRMFYGKKDSSYLVWPVCGTSRILPQTGQTSCYDQKGKEIACHASAQDGALLQGVAWPSPRFVEKEHGIEDMLTGMIWRNTIHSGKMATWDEALATIAALNRQTEQPWRLPTINELESLVDASCHSPALPHHHPFKSVQDAYWSSTTSFFEPDWAYVLYMHKGAVGVGYKPNQDFAIWPVMRK